MNEKVIVIGSNCFSGAHFVKGALDGGMTVVGISRSVEPDDVFLPYKWGQQPHVENFSFLAYDINLNLSAITDLIEKIKPDYIVNFAAQGMVAPSWENPEQWFLTNTVASAALVKKIHGFSFLKKYVQISTPEVYGTNDRPVCENTNYHPSTPYAVSKAAADMNLMAFVKEKKFPCVFTRAANVFGPGQQLYRIIPRTILYFLLGKKLYLHGGGQSKRSFIHISDVVDGTLRVMKNAQPGSIFHFSTDRLISIKELVKKIAHMMDVSFKENVVEVGELAGKDAAYILDSAKAKKILGWEAKVELEHGIYETISWIKENMENLKKHPFDYQHKP